MLNEDERKATRAKIRQELEEKEQERLAKQEKLTQEKTVPQSGQPDATPPPSSEESGAQDAVTGQPTGEDDRYTTYDWAEIEKIKLAAEEEWYSSRPDYIQYIDKYGNKKWIHRILYEHKKEKERSRKQLKMAHEKKNIRSLILIGSTFCLAVILVLYYLNSRHYCSFHVVSNIKGATIFVDDKRTNFDTDALVTGVSPGRHKVAVYKPNYTRKTQIVELSKGDTLLLHFELEIDSQSAMIAEAESSAVEHREEIVPFYTPGSAQIAPAIAEREKTALQINCNVPDAVIKIDGKPTHFEVNRTIESIPPGSHFVEIEKPGYRSDPVYASINLQKGAPVQYIAFELTREHPLILTVRTEPVEGDIFIGDILMGHGETVKEHQLPGRFTISFGKVRGYRTPEPIETQLSERNPSATVVGKYLPIIEMAASLGQNGQIVKQKVQEIRTGYYYSNTGPVPSEEYGPQITKLELYNIYAYEMGYAFARRNPPGNDYVEVIFSLPENFNENKILYLTLKGLASDNNYLFNLTKVTDIAIDVNGKTVVAHHSPINNLDREEPLGRDSWPISNFLKIGENRVVVRTTEDNKCYYYLHSIEIN